MNNTPENLRDLINIIIKELHFSDEDFQLVRLTKYKQIIISVLEKFTTLKKSEMKAWWWEFLREPRFSFYPNDVFAVLPLLIENNETVWFVIEDESKSKEQDKYWLYEGKIHAVISLLKELSFTEYYIISKKLEWILCENHHNLLIGSGKLIVKKMKSIAENSQVRADCK